MKKLLAMLLCGVMTVSMLAGCGSKEEAKEAAPAEETAAEETADEDTKEEGLHLVVGLSPTYVNFETVKVNADGSEGYEGIDIEILEALSQKCGFTYEIDRRSGRPLLRDGLCLRRMVQ